MTLRHRLDRLERELSAHVPSEPLTVHIVFQEADGSYVDLDGHKVEFCRPRSRLICFD